MTCLVTGATGNIGGRVTRQLIERRDRPRILVRDAQTARAACGDRVEIVVGDLTDVRALATAFDGVLTLFLVSAGRDIVTIDAAVAKVAKAAGLSRIVKLSSLDVRRAGGSAASAWHAQGEAAMRRNPASSATGGSSDSA